MAKKDSNQLSRRTFIKNTGLTTSMFSLYPFLTPSTFNNSTDERRIIVIGAGLAGLSCAYELDKAGYNVLLIEASSSPGGRISTHRTTFSDNLYSEMGAEYVDSSDTYIHKYCKMFGLNILPAKQYDGVYVKGQRLSIEGLKSGKETLPYKGTHKGKLFGQEVKYIQKWIDLVKQKGVGSPEVQALDMRSVEDILKEGGATNDIIDLYTYANATEETTLPSKMSALQMVLSNTRTSSFSENTVEGRIFGGNDQLPKMFAKKLDTKILYNRPLQSLDYDSNGVTVTVNENQKPVQISAKKCVLAIPTTILKNININPGFSPEKMKCIKDQQYGHAMKIAMQYTERFWGNKKSIGQRVFTDTPLRRVYHFSVDQPGPRGILLSFTSGEDAKKLGKLDNSKRLEIAKSTCKNIWRESEKFWEKGVVKYWNEDPWAKASYSFDAVGQQSFRKILAKPEGPVFFAGEHTAIQRASMNGAIESGLRVVEEIKNSNGGKT